MADGKVIIDTYLNSKGAEQGVSKLKKGLTGIGSVAKTGLSVAGKAIGVASTGIAAFGTYAIKAGANFEAGMSKVQAISGANAKEMELLAAKAKEMGAKTKFSASEAADAFSYMAMAGWKSEDMLEGIEGIMNLAAASGEDLAATSDIVTDALTAFGLSAKDSNRFADVLAQTASNANTNVGLMGETFKYVAPVAGALGYSIEDTSVAIGLMANQGIKASSAGTALRSIFTNLAKPSKSVATAMKDLGVSLTDSSGKMKPLNKLMVEMRDEFKGLTKEQKAQYAASIAGKTGMSGLLAIVNASDKDFKKLTKSIADSNGAAAKMADTMQNNLSGQITILKSAIEGLAIEIYGSFKKQATQFVKAGTDIVSSIAEGMQKGNKKAVLKGVSDLFNFLISSIVKAAPTVINTAVNLMAMLANGILSNAGLIGKAIVSVVSNIGEKLSENAGVIINGLTNMLVSAINFVSTNLPDVFGFVVGFIGKIAAEIMNHAPEIANAVKNMLVSAFDTIGDTLPVLKPITSIFSVLAKNIEKVAAVVAPMIAAWVAYKAAMLVVQGVTIAVTAAQTALNAVMMANPIGLVVAGVAALVAGIAILSTAIRNQKTEQQKLNEIYEDTKKKAKELNDEEKSSISSVNELSKSFSSLNSAMKDNGTNITVEFQQTQKLWDELKKITDENGKIKKGYEERARVIAGELSQALGTEIKIVDGQIQGWKNLQKEIDNTIAKKKLEALIASDQAKYTEALKNQTKAYAELDNAEEKSRKNKEKLSAALKEAEKAQEKVKKAQEKYNTALADGNIFAQKYKQRLSEAKEEAAKAQGAVDGLSDKQKKLDENVSKAKNTVSDYNITIKNWNAAVDAAAKGSTKEMNEAFKALANNFKTADASTKESLQKQVEETKKAYKAIKKAYKDGGAGVTKEAVQNAKELVTAAKNELLKSKAAFNSMGQNAGAGYAEGIKLSKAKVQAEADSLAKAALYTVAKTQDSHSPSKKAKKLGTDFGEGYIIGIDSTRGKMQETAQSTMQSVIDAAEEASEKAKERVSTLQDALRSVIEEEESTAKQILELQKKARKQTGEERKETNKEIARLEKEQSNLVKKEGRIRAKLHKAELDERKKSEKAFYSESAREWLAYYDEINEEPSSLERWRETGEKMAETAQGIVENHQESVEKIKEQEEAELQEIEDSRQEMLEKATETYKTAYEQIDAEQNEALSTLKEQHESYYSGIEKIWDEKLDSLEKNYESTMSEILKNQEQLFDKTLNFVGLFDEAKAENVIDADTILGNAAAQTAKVKKYYEDMEKLISMNLPKEIVDQFKDMGVGAADQLEVFINMSDEQIQEFVNQYKKRAEISTKLAEDYYAEDKKIAKAAYADGRQMLLEQKAESLKMIKEEFDEEEAAMVANYEERKKRLADQQAETIRDIERCYDEQKETAIKKYKTMFDAEMANYRASMISLRIEVTEQAKTIGNSIKQGLMDGAHMTSSEATTVASNLTDSILSEVRSQLDIHSPSGVFTKIGDLCLQGFELPFKKYNPAGVMNPAINKVINKTSMLKNTTPTNADNSVTNTATLNFYDTQTSPDAIYRKFNQTMRYGLAGGIA